MGFRQVLPRAALAAGLAALLVAPAAEAASYRVGVGEQNPAMFDSARWQSLKLKRVRYLVPWNWARSAGERAAVVAYMNRSRAARQQVLVTFTARRGCFVSGRYSKRKACRAPSARAYRAAFRAFDKLFPWVKTYSAWNEVNHVSQPTYRKPRVAVRYYDVLRKDARRRKFKVMAADVLDTSNMRSYLRGFMRLAKGRPRLWGLHNYQDVNYKTSADTRTMLATVPGTVWLTETGGLVKFQGRRFRYSEERARDRTRYMFKLAGRYDSRRRGLRSQIAQLFVYKWYGEPRGARFDAGLVNPDGTPRKAFAVLRANARKHR
jgi:Glycosyl hydrolase catalytic core